MHVRGVVDERAIRRGIIGRDIQESAFDVSEHDGRLRRRCVGPNIRIEISVRSVERRRDPTVGGRPASAADEGEYHKNSDCAEQALSESRPLHGSLPLTLINAYCRKYRFPAE